MKAEASAKVEAEMMEKSKRARKARVAKVEGGGLEFGKGKGVCQGKDKGQGRNHQDGYQG